MSNKGIILAVICLLVVSIFAVNYNVADAVIGGVNLGNACDYNLNGGYLYGEKLKSTSTKGHHGIDWLAPKGSNVYAMYDGDVVTVDQAGTNSYYKYIVIESQHPDYASVKFYHLYAHLDKNDYFTEGDPVSKGDLIGKSGDNNGNIGAHLHTEIRMRYNDYNAVRNPECLLYRSTSGGYGGLYGKVYDSNNDFKKLVKITGAPKADTYNYGSSLTYYKMKNGNDFLDESAYDINYYIGKVDTGSVTLTYNSSQTVNDTVYANSDHAAANVTLN